MSPIFIQFLDAVWQLVHLFPAAFEFNTRYLLCIAEHFASCRFGTFLFNCARDRQREALKFKAVSLWSYLRLNRTCFEQCLYRKDPGDPINCCAVAEMTDRGGSNSFVGCTDDTSAVKMQGLAQSIVSARSNVLLPPASLVLRGVALWEDFFCRYSPRHTFTHLPFVNRASKRRGTLGGTLYDENYVDNRAAGMADLKVSSAAYRGADWEGFIKQETFEKDRWRVKAQKDKMKMLQVTGDVMKSVARDIEEENVSVNVAAPVSFLAEKDKEILMLRAHIEEQEKQIREMRKAKS